MKGAVERIREAFTLTERRAVVSKLSQHIIVNRHAVT